MASTRDSVSQALHLDYSLIGVNARAAIEKGLAEADWYAQALLFAQVVRESFTTASELLEKNHAPHS